MVRLGTGGLVVAAAVAGALSAMAFSGIRSTLAANGAGADLHSFLHEEIKLDAAENTRLEAKEDAYEAKRLEIENRLKAANGRLAAAIQTDPRWTPEIEAASREVEAAAGDLQRVTLQHIFEMREGLDENHRNAYDRVLIDALKRGAK